MKNIVSLFLNGVSYIANSFYNISVSHTSYSYKSFSKDSNSLNKDWINVGNDIQKVIGNYENLLECPNKFKSK